MSALQSSAIKIVNIAKTDTILGGKMKSVFNKRLVNTQPWWLGGRALV